MDAGYKRIFAAVDGGETQRSVMEKAILIAAVNHADLCFGHVVDSAASEASSPDMERLAQGVGERMELEYADLLKEARRNPDIPSVELRVLAGSVTDTLGGTIIPEFDPRPRYLLQTGPIGHSLRLRGQREHLPHPQHAL